jgi:hypothetical protein
MTPLRAIRLKCVDCSAGEVKRVRECPITSCALWPFRLGHNPNRAGIGGNPQLTGRLGQERGKDEHGQERTT